MPPEPQLALDDAVLERLVREHDDATADLEGVERGRDGPLEHASSWLTSMRSAWNTRFAGCPARWAAAGVAAIDQLDELARTS